MTLKKENRRITLFLAVGTLVAAILALVVAVLDGVLGWGVTPHAILTFLWVFAIASAICLLVSGFGLKIRWHVFLGATLFLLSAVFGAFLVPFLVRVGWWIVLLIGVVLAIAFVSLSLIIIGSNMEEIALNNHEEYKNYKERQAEKDAARKEEEANLPPLPEIKSFKDEK